MWRLCFQYPDSVSKTSKNSSYGLKSTGTNGLGNLVVVPGVTTGEGCSIHGGCASCSYMKATGKLPDKLVGQILGGKDNRIPTPR